MSLCPRNTQWKHTEGTKVKFHTFLISGKYLPPGKEPFVLTPCLSPTYGILGWWIQSRNKCLKCYLTPYISTSGPRRKDERGVKGGDCFSSGRRHHVKEILGHWGPVSHKRGRDIQGQWHMPWSSRENSIIWSVVFRPLLIEESKKPLYMSLYVGVKAVYW